jgi:hypothetical protein
LLRALHLDRAGHRLAPGWGIDEDRGQHVVEVVALLGTVELDPLRGEDGHHFAVDAEYDFVDLG